MNIIYLTLYAILTSIVLNCPPPTYQERLIEKQRHHMIISAQNLLIDHIQRHAQPYDDLRTQQKQSIIISICAALGTGLSLYATLNTTACFQKNIETLTRFCEPNLKML